ncbi:MAG: hypothetical protein FWE84_04660 [Firmicutes bacterium]|nr:hypothetical protein [Bacillota bacterium]
MDYAKLALLKAEELEKKGDSLSPRISRKGLVIKKVLGAGESYTVCKLKGKGEAGVVLSLDFAPFSGQTFVGNVAFLIGNRTVFARDAAQTMLFTASVMLDGETTLKIKTEGALTFLSADVLSIGAEILGPAGADVKTDCLSGYICAVYENEGQIRLCADINPPNLGDYVIAGFGSKPAVAAFTEGGEVCFGILFIDGGELVFGLFDKDKGQVSCVYTGINAQSAALMRYGGCLAVGYVFKGVAYVGLLIRPDFTITQSFKLEEACGIEFVKESVPAAVILNKNGKNVIRTAQAESSYDDAVRLKIGCTVS